MVNLTNSLLYALLASAASAQLKHDSRHHQHRRRKEPCTTADASASAPYPIGNGTIVAPTGSAPISTSLTTTVSATTTLLSTVTVVPVPASSGAGAISSGAAASPSGGAPGGGSPSGGAPGSGGSSSAAASGGLGGSGGSPGACGPATTVTITAQNTVTVTEGEAPSGASSVAAASSSPVAASSAPAASSPAATSSAAAASSPAASPPASSPAASPSSTSAAAVASNSPSPSPVQASSSAAAGGQGSPSQPSGSSSAASAASSPASAPSGGKCGAAYTQNGQISSSSTFNGQNTPWAYNWYFESGGLPEGIEYVPSLQKPEWTQSLVSALPAATGAKYVKSINEPDQPSSTGGSGVTPQDAVALYSGTLDALAGQYKIGTPSVTSDNTTSGPLGASGIQWLSAFKQACGDSNCKVSWVDLHWYGDAQSGDAQNQAKLFLEYVDQAITDVRGIFGSDVEVWFTEVSAYPLLNSGDSTAPSVNSDFISAIAGPLASKDVARWAYFTAPLLESAGLADTLLKAVSGGS